MANHADCPLLLSAEQAVATLPMVAERARRGMANHNAHRRDRRAFRDARDTPSPFHPAHARVLCYEKMITVTPTIQISEDELRFEFIRSSGPGGQNVNKVATAVQLRFDAATSPSLPEPVRERLIALAGRRATKDGEIIITAQRFRTQERNREDAVERLVTLIRRAAARPKTRRRTRPPAQAKERRLREKKRRGAVKRLRRPVDEED